MEVELKKPKETREFLKKYRFTKTELLQIEVVLVKTGWTLTEFFREALQAEVQKHYFYVPTLKQSQGKYVKKNKTIIPVVTVEKRYENTDPKLLIELARIGNNVNQMARALNFIKNGDSENLKTFDFIQCQVLLKAIQTDLHSVLPELPEIKRSNKSVKTQQKRIIDHVSKIS